METVLEQPVEITEEQLVAAKKDDKILMGMFPTYWVSEKKIRLANGELFSFKERPYLIDPMKSEHKQICVMKAAGMGFSETFILRELHACMYGLYPQGSLYLFPNADEMRKFSQSRFNTLIQANKESIGRFVKSGGRGGTDTANLKRIGGANLFMDGATLTQSVGDSVQQKESPALRGKHVDSINFDEIDLMDRDIISQADSRLSNSKLKRITAIANPTIPNFGVDLLWQLSNQLWWWRKCECGVWNCPDLEFPNYIELDRDGKGFCACKTCGKPLPLGVYDPNPEHPGHDKHSCEWRPDRPENKLWEGYHISKLNHPRVDPYDMLSKFKRLQDSDGNLANFYKFDLGLPFIDADNQLNTTSVLDCCGNNLMSESTTHECAMGVDVGQTWHVVIGVRIGKEKWEILKVARVGSIEEVQNLAIKYHVKSAVLDIRPYEDTVRKFQSSYKGRVYLCEYSVNPMEEAVWDNNRKIVKSYRTGLLDLTGRLITTKRIVLPRVNTEIKEFAKQLCGTAKVLGENTRTHTPIYSYIKLGDDHYRHALGYFYLAASGHRIATVSSSSERKQELVCVNEYKRI